MVRVRNTNKKVRLEGSFVNSDSGETLESQMGGVKSVNVPDDTYVMIESNSFYIVEAEAMEYVSTVLSAQDFEKLCKMMQWVGGEYNLLCDTNGNPLAKPDVMSKLDYSRSRFDALIRRLKKEGIIYIVDGFVKRKSVKWIMMNPFLARRRRKLHKECTKYFDQLKNV